MLPGGAGRGKGGHRPWAAGSSAPLRRSTLRTGADGPPVASPYHPPVKRSVEIAGHKTSISLEPVFWDMLKARAATEGVPLNALVARIDAERLEAETPPGLAGAIRIWLVSQ